MSETEKGNIFNSEISKLGLTDRDTLVDIGAFSGFTDFQLFQFYPNKFFILEDIYKSYEKSLPGAYIIVDSTKRYFKDYSLRITGTNEYIPLKSSAYKTVYCRKTVHEFTKPDKMVEELKRIISVDGVLIISEEIPLFPNETDPGCKKKLMTSEEIIDLFKSHRLKLRSSDTTNWKQNRNLYILKFTK